MRTVRILILEDDLRALSFLINRLGKLEETLDSIDFAITVLSEYTQVEEYINNTKMNFDIILLDRDCKACGSFHCLNIEKIGADKVISISAMPQWNEEAERRGVKRVVLKTHEAIEDFSEKVVNQVNDIIQNN